MSRRPDPLAQVSDFDIRLLKIYRSVVECGGFSAAENVLGIGRSAISQQMNDLEQRLGLRLCQRGRAGFSLTEEGREVYHSALQLLSALETFRTEVNGLHQHLRGELNIGLTDNLVTLPHMRITHALAELKDRGPDVRIQIRMIAPARSSTACSTAACTLASYHRPARYRGLSINRCTANARCCTARLATRCSTPTTSR